jgi:hypothetical protein
VFFGSQGLTTTSRGALQAPYLEFCTFGCRGSLPRWRLVSGKQGTSGPVLRAWRTPVAAADRGHEATSGITFSPTAASLQGQVIKAMLRYSISLLPHKLIPNLFPPYQLQIRIVLRELP